MGGLPDNGVVIEDLSSTMLPFDQLSIREKGLQNTHVNNIDHVSKFKNSKGITKSVHGTIYGESPMEKPIAAAAAAYSCFFGGVDNSPAISPREDIDADEGGQYYHKNSVFNSPEMKDFCEALDVAAQIDHLKTRGPSPPRLQRSGVVMTPKTTKSAIKIVNRISGHTDGKKVLQARAKKKKLSRYA